MCEILKNPYFIKNDLPRYIILVSEANLNYLSLKIFILLHMFQAIWLFGNASAFIATYLFYYYELEYFYLRKILKVS